MNASRAKQNPSLLKEIRDNTNLSMDEFIDIMTEARAVTKERMASIKKRTKEGDKTKMGYFFAILEARLGLRTA